MAKVNMTVQLKKDSGATIGQAISSEKPTRSEAEAEIAAVIQQRVDSGAQGQTDLLAAQAAFNS